MNRAHNVVWSTARGAWVVTSEFAHKRTKAARSILALSFAALLAVPACAAASALPHNGEITRGQGAISQSGNAMIINQGSDKVAINWESFNVGKDSSVTFVQPGSSAIALNRVIGADISSIQGTINANGKVFLINPNGVVFDKDSKVDVGGLVASTLSLSDEDFLGDKFTFESQGGHGSIVANGSIKAKDGGYVLLLGREVSNEGTVVAKLGTVAMASGDQITIDFSGDGLLNLQVDRANEAALVNNKGMIQANGGQVLLTGRSSDSIIRSVVNNSGIIEAQTLSGHKGKILLHGGMDNGGVTVAGTLDVRALEKGDGGYIDTSARQVTVEKGAKVLARAALGKSGDWLIDPTDLKVVSGEELRTPGSIGADTLSASLEEANVELRTVDGGADQGNIHVNADVAWSGDNTLTLSAHGNIFINAEISASGANAGLNLNHGIAGASNTFYQLGRGAKVDLSGASSSFGVNGTAYTVIHDLSTLQSLGAMGLGGNYVLGNSIDASETANWNAGAGFVPIASFTGTFDGLGNVIEGLKINRNVDNLGLFKQLNGGTIQNLGLENINITGRQQVGGLVGSILNGTVKNSYTTGTVKGGTNGTRSRTGGLAGFSDNGKILDSYSKATVTAPGGTGGDSVGGLIGNSYNTILQNVYATGNVAGYSNTGGLVGYAVGGSLLNGYAHGDVTATRFVGGLAGGLGAMALNNVYAIGDVSGSFATGGLVGYTEADINTAFSSGAVSGNARSGGLVGEAWRASIINAFSTASVTGTDQVGGLIGLSAETDVDYAYSSGHVTGGTLTGGMIGDYNLGSVSNAFWDMDTSGQSLSAAGEGKSHAQMLSGSTFSGWDADAVAGSGKEWRIYEGYDSPILRAFLTRVDLSPQDISLTYNSSTQIGGIDYNAILNHSKITSNFWHQGASLDQSRLEGSITSLLPARNAGVYQLNNGLYSSPFGYDFAFTRAASLTINKASLSIAPIVSNKVYDGALNAVVDFADNRYAGDSLSISGSAAFLDKNAGVSKVVNVIDIDVTGDDAQNYTWLTSTSSSADISKADLTVNAQGIDRSYNGTTDASVNFSDNRLAGDELSITANAAFSDKNAGLDKTVAVSSISVTGADAGNYNWNISASTVADIAKADLLITAQGMDRVYDGTTHALVNLFDNRLAEDELSISVSAEFTDKHAGLGKTINLSDISVSGVDANNYTWNTSASTTGNIAKADLDVSAQGVDRVYDSTTNATVNFSDNRIAGDDLFISADTYFVDKHAGAGKTVNVAGISITGSDARNYTWNSNASTTADISKAELTVSAQGVDRMYDGTTEASVVLWDNRFSGDDLVLAANASFLDKNAEIDKTINVSSVQVTGVDAGNYSWSDTTQTSASISKAFLNLASGSYSKKEGMADPLFGWSIQSGGLFAEDKITGAPSRVAGEGAGVYAVDRGTVSAGNNYNVSWTPGSLVIEAAMPDPVLPEPPVYLPEPEMPKPTPAVPNLPAVQIPVSVIATPISAPGSLFHVKAEPADNIDFDQADNSSSIVEPANNSTEDKAQARDEREEEKAVGGSRRIKEHINAHNQKTMGYEFINYGLNLPDDVNR